MKIEDLDVAAPLREDELRELPIFPLPRSVFFPGSVLPLHIFEARYVQMVEDALAGNAVIAIALLRPGFEDDYNGRPPIHEVAGAGRIVHHRQNPDGTWDIVLRGVARLKLEELLPDERLYRVARATVLSDEGERPPRHDMVAMWSCGSRVAEVVRKQHPEFQLGVTPDDPPGQIADTLADRFVAKSALRQEILEATDLSERTSLIIGAVGELLAMLAENQQPS